MKFVFPLTSVALNLGAAICYARAGDFGRMAYWLLAAGLTTTLTFWVR